MRDFEQDRNPRNRNFDALNFRKTAFLNPAFVKPIAYKFFLNNNFSLQIVVTMFYWAQVTEFLS